VINGLLANEPLKVAAGGQHFRSSGTSMSGPMVAGMCALYLQRYPTATWQDVKNDLLSCPTIDAFTGSNLPDNAWGYGKANAYNLLHGCLIGVDEIENNAILTCFPNPFSETTTISYDFQSTGKAELVISDMLGKEIIKEKLTYQTDTYTLNKGQLRPGMYFYSLVINGKVVKTNKLAVM